METNSSGQIAVSNLNRPVYKKPKDTVWRKMLKNRLAYLFILPWLILFLTFTLYPLLFSFYISLTNYSPLNSATIHDFLGFKNYAEMFTDHNFGISLRNTFVFTIGTIPFTTVFAMLLAVALNQGIKLKSLFRVGFFMPTVTSLAVISLLFKLLLYRDGLLSKFVVFLGLQPKNWLLDSKSALLCIMVMDIWVAVGYYMIIYLASLQSIPMELYEAATMDGANPVQKFFSITLPNLRQVTIFVIVMNTINSLQVFTEPQIMTQGGPAYATTTGVLYLYRAGFAQQRMGYASAVAYALFAIILIFSVLQMTVLKINKGVDE